jgi:hypothetical protein
MAIYSLNVRSVGKSTHAAGTAGAHIRYIGRDRAAPEIIAAYMPAEPNKARTWMDRQEDGDRKNGRVCDKIRVALPRELDAEQRRQLLQDFCQTVTGGRVAYFAAIHQSGKDAHNPHAHIVIRDRDIDTGHRVLRWSDNKRDREKAGLPVNAVEHIRECWEQQANQALERAGHAIRIDRRSLSDQGVDRVPTIHIGPNAKHVDDTVHRPISTNRQENSWWRSYRDEIPYEFIDAGRTRQERNAEIIDLNLERASRSPDFGTRERAKLQKELAHQERTLENRLVAEARQQTFEERQVRAAYRKEWTAARQLAREEVQATRGMLADSWRSSRKVLSDRHVHERNALESAQSTITARLLRTIDITGRTRAQQRANRDALKRAQEQQRRELARKHSRYKAVLLDAVSARHDPILKDIQKAHACAQADLADKHQPSREEAEQLRQRQEAARQEAENRLEAMLRQLSRDQDRNNDRGMRPRMR